MEMVKEAVEAGADIIMLDNMDDDMLKKLLLILIIVLRLKFQEMSQKKTLQDLQI